MVTLDWETERTDGVTLVRLYVTGEYRRRVRVENRLDGPVWPPRREGQPAAGWDDGAFEGVVTPDERLVAGYATPAPPADPPAEVVSEEPADPDAPPGPAGTGSVDVPGGGDRPAATDGGGGAGATGGTNAWAGTGFQPPNGDAGSGDSSDGEPTPEAVVRSLGDPVVPREAVPVPDAPGDGDDGEQRGVSPTGGVDGTGETDATGGTDDENASTDAGGVEDTGRTDAAGGVEDSGRADVAGGTEEGDDVDADSVEDGDGTADERLHERRAAGEPGSVGAPGDPDGARAPGTDAQLVVPGAVRAWLRDVDRRLSAVERRQAVEAVDPDPTLGIAVAGDRRALTRVADRVETLSARAAAVERRTGGDGRR